MHSADQQDSLVQILKIIEDLTHITDLDDLLDRVLLAARKLTRADAGSIYLIENQELHFSYIHNDTLFKSSTNNKLLYSNHTVPVDRKSLAGYVALTGEPLIIDDVYHLPASLPFSFNHYFDEQTGYCTRSILTLPLKSTTRVVGVLQIINPLDQDGGPAGFTVKDQTVLTYLANNAAAAIERARLTREIFLRMVKMCELHDPKETGPHVCRVAAYAAEIYHRWAERRSVPEDLLQKTKAALRIGAMLHDLGKIAISDLILKKPGKLDPDEFHIMKYHTIYGARFFPAGGSELDVMAAEIALNHHERWDGGGYPGRISNFSGGEPAMGPGKKGEEIPLAARIVALADVYDALVSSRSYKDSFPEEDALDYIRAASGQQFDPEVVRAFLEIHEVILAIKEKYQDSAVDLALRP
jgi:HD-GYP domain-containing protein (c-di-GMP phosphodiesterase class II)